MSETLRFVTDSSLAVDDLSWQDGASCRGANADLFFPERGASTRKAKGICAACQVQVDCLRYAVANNEESGIWGGLTERQRRSKRGEFVQAARAAKST